MVNERAPPNTASSKDPLQSSPSNNDNLRREKSPDSDADFDTLFKGISSIKKTVHDGLPGSFFGSSSQESSSGHGQMLSSRKQKASNVFIQQKSRPEHHLDTRVRGPLPPKTQARKPAPLAVFDSLTAQAPASQSYGEEVFYTDPSKASADLKDLLEGNMDDDEDKAEPQAENKDGAQATQESKNPKDGTLEGLKVKLLPHQVEGVEWMRGRELGPVKRGKVPKGGILADDMGLGKTLQTLSLILTNQKPNMGDKSWKKHFEGLEKTTLVVAPLALIRQWESEVREKIAKTHELKVLVHHGPNRTKRFTDLARYDIVITTYQILVSEHSHSSPTADGVKAGCFGLHWWRVVLDEAHTIKNRNAKATKACCDLRSEYRWCLSGTPMQNNLDELQSLVKFLRIKPYDDLKEWKEHIDKPMKNGKGHVAIRRLHSLLRCFMKRRTKDILKEKGALNPGGKTAEGGGPASNGFKVTERKVVTVSTELSPAERKFYTKLEQRADRSIEAMLGGKVNYASALTLLLRLRQACNHPKLVEGKLEKDKDAMSTDSTQQKSQDADVDSMADMLAGMGIATKHCSICGLELERQEVERGNENCTECASDLAYFNSHESRDRKKSNKKSKVKKVEKKAIVPSQKSSQRARNRNAVIDSDDEEGSWLVPEAERGSLRTGKAGGEEDENAEGGGDCIGSEDSEDDEGDDNHRSNLSFVVDDETARKEKGYISANEAADDSGDDNSLISVDAITKQLASQKLVEGPGSLPSDTVSASASDLSDDSGTDESDSGVDESSIDNSDDDDHFGPSRRTGSTQVLASAKIRELVKILHKEVNEHKFIVFSQFTSMLDLVEPFLRKEGFKFTRYDGSMRNDDREESLRRLRQDKSTRILLCSLKCGSLGLNLTAATRVVIIEPFWNPFVEEQAIDRVHRLTQTVDVIVYKLTVRKTVEERIIDLQDKKRLLAEQAIEGGMKKGAFKLGLNEIIELFKPSAHESRAEEHLSGTGDVRQAARDLRNVMFGGSKPAPVKRQESQIYGRRW